MEDGSGGPQRMLDKGVVERVCHSTTAPAMFFKGDKECKACKLAVLAGAKETHVLLTAEVATSTIE